MRASRGTEAWSSASPAPAVLRAGAILEAIAAAPSRSLSLPELAAQLGIPRSSTANICAALEQIGMVVLEGGRYRLGRQIVALSGRFAPPSTVVARFEDVADRLRGGRDELLHLSSVDGLNAVLVARSATDSSIPLPARVGQVLPANATAAGKAVLAQLAPGRLDDLLGEDAALAALTDATVRDRGGLRAELDRTRERGYAVGDEEAYPGAFEIAVPLDAGTEGAYALSAWTLKGWADRQRDPMLDLVRRIAAELTGA